MPQRIRCADVGLSGTLGVARISETGILQIPGGHQIPTGLLAVDNGELLIDELGPVVDGKGLATHLMAAGRRLVRKSVLRSNSHNALELSPRAHSERDSIIRKLRTPQPPRHRLTSGGLRRVVGGCGEARGWDMQLVLAVLVAARRMDGETGSRSYGSYAHLIIQLINRHVGHRKVGATQQHLRG